MEAKITQDSPIPDCKTREELMEYLGRLLDHDPQDYDTVVYATAQALCATHDFMARAFGLTGFQSSVADLEFLQRKRKIEGPFMLLRLDTCLYPQYPTLEERARKFERSKEAKEWLREAARKKLQEPRGEYDESPKVIAHWEELANG